MDSEVKFVIAVAMLMIGVVPIFMWYLNRTPDKSDSMALPLGWLAFWWSIPTYAMIKILLT